MTPSKDDEEFKEEPVVQVEEAIGGGVEVTGGDDDVFDGDNAEEAEYEDADDDNDDDDEEDEDEEDEEEEDLGTEYLVRPVGEAEDDEDASDFEPEENAVEEDIDEEYEEEEEVDEGNNLSAGKSESLPKRKRVAKDQSEQVVTDDDDRPSKRLL